MKPELTKPDLALAEWWRQQPGVYCLLVYRGKKAGRILASYVYVTEELMADSGEFAADSAVAIARSKFLRLQESEPGRADRPVDEGGAYRLAGADGPITALTADLCEFDAGEGYTPFELVDA